MRKWFKNNLITNRLFITLFIIFTLSFIMQFLLFYEEKSQYIFQPDVMGYEYPHYVHQIQDQKDIEQIFNLLKKHTSIIIDNPELIQVGNFIEQNDQGFSIKAAYSFEMIKRISPIHQQNFILDQEIKFNYIAIPPPQPMDRIDSEEELTRVLNSLDKIFIGQRDKVKVGEYIVHNIHETKYEYYLANKNKYDFKPISTLM